MQDLIMFTVHTLSNMYDTEIIIINKEVITKSIWATFHFHIKCSICTYEVSVCFILFLLCKLIPDEGQCTATLC